MPGKTNTYKKQFEAITKRVETMATKTYKEAYKDADKSKYKSEAEFIKAAKAYNTKKYGTTEPTKTAKDKGVSKEELAKSKSDSKVKMETIKAKPIAPVKPSAPKAKSTMEKAEDAIKAGDAKGAKKAIKDSDMKGKVKRKVKRVAGQEARKTKRAQKKTEKTDKKIEKIGEKIAKQDLSSEKGFAKADKLNKKAGSMTSRYDDSGSPAAYFRQKIRYNNSAKDVAIRVAADEKDKGNASEAGKKRLDKDISSMISHASMKTNAMNYKTNAMRYDTMADKHHGGMPKMKTNQDGGAYAAKNPSAPGKQLKKLGSILSKFMTKNK